jgi:hypothetical protein
MESKISSALATESFRFQVYSRAELSVKASSNANLFVALSDVPKAPDNATKRLAVDRQLSVEPHSRWEASPINTILPPEITVSSLGPPNMANSSHSSGASITSLIVSQYSW